MNTPHLESLLCVCRREINRGMLKGWTDYGAHPSCEVADIDKEYQAVKATIATLRGALLAMVACPDYRNIQTHEMERARKALKETQP